MQNTTNYEQSKADTQAARAFWTSLEKHPDRPKLVSAASCDDWFDDLIRFIAAKAKEDGREDVSRVMHRDYAEILGAEIK